MILLWVFSFSVHENHACSRTNRSTNYAPPRVSDSVSLRWGLGICISYKFPGDAVASGPGITLLESLLSMFSLIDLHDLCPDRWPISWEGACFSGNFFMGPLSSCSPGVGRLLSGSAGCRVIRFRGGHACHTAEPGRGPGSCPVLCIHPVPIRCTLSARRCSKDTELWRVTDQWERQTRGRRMRRGSRWGLTGERASRWWPGCRDYRTRG